MLSQYKLKVNTDGKEARRGHIIFNIQQEKEHYQQLCMTYRNNNTNNNNNKRIIGAITKH